MPGERATWNRERRLALGGAAALALAYALVAVASPEAVGLWQDDGIYAATAAALAAGEGYRHDELAGRPFQTKYPILYPALLSLAFRAAGSPASRVALLAPSALAAAALVALSMLYARRVLRLPARAVWPLAALAAASPAIVAFVRYAMSDLVYGALAAGALVCLDAGPEAGAGAGRARRRAVLGGLLVGLALLTRTIGVSLAAAAVALPLARRRFAEAGFVALPIAACALPWWIWRAWAADANGALQGSLLYGVELSYAAWLPSAWGEPLRVAGHNLLRTAIDIAHFQLALPLGFVGRALAGDGTAWLHAVVWAVVAALGIGFARSLRGGVRTLHLYALAYAGAVLVWPFEPHRFWLPWTPFLLLFLVWGLWLPGRGRALAAAAGAGLALLFALDDARVLASSDERYYLRERADGLDLTELRAVEAWIRENTAPSDVIASARPARLFLRTGRRGVVSWPDRDPYTRYYGRDRSAWTFTALPSRSEALAMTADIRAHWREAWRDAGVTHYVEDPRERDHRAFAAAVGPGSAAFELAYASPGGALRVYRVHLERE